MSEAKNKADSVIAWLETNHHPGHGFNRIFGSMKRKELNAIRDGIADIIEGKSGPVVELKPLPVPKTDEKKQSEPTKTDAAVKATPVSKPKSAPAQA